MNFLVTSIFLLALGTSTLSDSKYIRGFRIFQTSRYQGIVKATVSGVVEDFKFKISEGLDPNWCFPDSAQLAVSAKLR